MPNLSLGHETPYDYPGAEDLEVESGRYLYESFTRPIEEGLGWNAMLAGRFEYERWFGEKVDAKVARDELAKRGLSDRVTVPDGGMSRYELDVQQALAQNRIRREVVFGAKATTGQYVAGVASMLGGAALQPESLVGGFGVMGGRGAAAIGRATSAGGAAAAAARVAAIEGAAGAAALEPLSAYLAYRTQRDYTIYDSVANILLSSALSAPLGAASGALDFAARRAAAAPFGTAADQLFSVIDELARKNMLPEEGAAATHKRIDQLLSDVPGGTVHDEVAGAMLKRYGIEPTPAKIRALERSVRAASEDEVGRAAADVSFARGLDDETAAGGDLLEAIRQRGGINVDGTVRGTEIAEAVKQSRLGARSKEDRTRTFGLLNGRGLDPDKMRESLIEAGYLRGDKDVSASTVDDELIPELERALAGERVAMVGAGADEAGRKLAQQELDDAGVTDKDTAAAARDKLLRFRKARELADLEAGRIAPDEFVARVADYDGSSDGLYDEVPATLEEAELRRTPDGRRFMADADELSAKADDIDDAQAITKDTEFMKVQVEALRKTGSFGDDVEAVLNEGLLEAELTERRADGFKAALACALEIG